MIITAIILDIIRSFSNEGISPQGVHNQLYLHGFNQKEVRNALSVLWDEGEIRLGIDRKLRINEEGNAK